MLRVHCAVLNARTRPMPGSTCAQSYGGHGERETPGNIPNPEAKPLSADGTAPGTGWESRTPPDNHSTKGPHHSGGGPSSCLEWSAPADLLGSHADVVREPPVERHEVPPSRPDAVES